VSGEPCRLCGGATEPLFEAIVLGRHQARYSQCLTCRFTQVREPDWLDEAYTEAIHPTDTGLVARNVRGAAIIATFLHLSGVRGRPVLDEAGGYGILTRLLRDSGFDAYWSDRQAPNLFAAGYEWREDLGPPAAITALEVLEHFVRPCEDFGRIAARGADYIVTSTELPPGGRPAPGWAYLAPATGQHVAFYTPETLRTLGGMCGYPVVHAGRFLQVFARRSFPGWRWRAALRLGEPFHFLLRRLRPSFTVSDSEAQARRAPDHR
jgi:hypothetical protein